MNHLPAVNKDLELGTLTQDDIYQKSWKYIGYKYFAEFASRSEDFFSLRSYDRLHCRILLSLQDRVGQLEEELDLLDDNLSNKGAENIHNGTFRGDPSQKRKDLLKNISEELKAYDDMIIRYLALKARPRAQPSTIKNMKKWLVNRNNPIKSREVKFLDSDDLMSMAVSKKSAMRASFELWILHPALDRLGWFRARTKQERDEALESTTVYGRDEPVAVLASFAVFFMACAMLVAPLWILAIVENRFKQLGIITGFIIIMLVILTWATLAKPFEVFAATAGYSAILVVFLQIVPSV